MARRKKVTPDMAPPAKPVEPSWKQPGEESAVVYEDELPWNQEKGICFEIKEHRERRFRSLGGHRLEVDAVLFQWVIELGSQRFQYVRTVTWMNADEAYIDRLRKEARLDMLYRAHREGVI